MFCVQIAAAMFKKSEFLTIRDRYCNVRISGVFIGCQLFLKFNTRKLLKVDGLISGWVTLQIENGTSTIFEHVKIRALYVS